jgi:hypothetical protein
VWRARRGCCRLYQHQARGADKIITDSIDARVEAERKPENDDEGTADALVKIG